MNKSRAQNEQQISHSRSANEIHSQASFQQAPLPFSHPSPLAPTLFQHLQKHYSMQFNERNNSDLFFADEIKYINRSSHNNNAFGRQNDGDDDEEEEEELDELDLEAEFDSICKDNQPSFSFCQPPIVPLSGVQRLDFNSYLNDFTAIRNSSAPVMKCFICSQYRSQFFCDYCIKSGDFTSSKQSEVIKERFAEKKLKFFKLKKRLDSVNSCLEERLNARIKANQLRHELEQRKENVQNLCNSLDATNREISELSKDCKELNKRLPLARNKNKKLSRKLMTLKADAENRQTLIHDKRLRVQNVGERIKQCARERISQLNEFIFPISVYQPEDGTEGDLINSCETSPLLTFSGESTTDSTSERDDNYFKREPRKREERLSIVEPWLPLDGDYSAYLVWAIQHKDLVPTSSILAENSLRNSTHRISSALAYATQLLAVIGFYLDCKFPRKLHFHEFHTRNDSNGRKVYLNEEQFTHKVAKLNANLFYFCVQQGIDLQHLHPKRTLRNLQILSDCNFSRRLGDVTPAQISPVAIQLAETHLSRELALQVDEDEFDLNLRGDREGNDDDLNELDWESVPEMPYASDALTYSNTASVTTNIISSVVSMWRAATRK